MPDPTEEQRQVARKIAADGIHVRTLHDGENMREWCDCRLTDVIAQALADQRDALLPFVREWDDDLDYDGIPDGGVTCPECQGGGEINKDGKPSKRYPPTHNPRCALAAALYGRSEDEVQTT